MTIEVKHSALEKFARDEAGYVIAAGRTTTSEVAVVKSARELLRPRKLKPELKESGHYTKAASKRATRPDVVRDSNGRFTAKRSVLKSGTAAKTNQNKKTMQPDGRIEKR